MSDGRPGECDDEALARVMREWVPDMSDLGASHDEEAVIKTVESRIENDRVREDALRWLLNHMTDDELAEIGLLRLPVDKDGKPWRVGDMYERADGVRRVYAYMYTVGIGWSIKDSSEHGWVLASGVVHHKATHSERIRECAQDLLRGRCERPDPVVGEDVGGTTVTVASRLAAIADELEADDE